MSEFPKLKNPIVLVPGMICPKNIKSFEYFFKIREKLEAAGNTVFIPSLPAVNSIERRSRDLKREIQKRFPNLGNDQKINIIAHSIGGLNARYMVSILGAANITASVTTISTPHLGSEIADLIVNNTPHELYRAINYIMKNFFASSIRPILHITTDHMEKIFNTKVTDVASVKYFSIATYIPTPVWRNTFPIFWAPSLLLNKLTANQKNDGLITLESQKWGEVLGVFKADHFSSVGQPFGFTFYESHIEIFETILTNLNKNGL